MVQDQNGQKPDGRKLFKTKRSRIVGVVGLAATAVILLILFLFLRGGAGDSSDIIMKVGDTVVYADEYDEFVEAAKDLELNEGKARQILIDYHKNMITLKDMAIPFNDTIIDIQWDNALINTYSEYEDIVKHENKADNIAARALALDSYVDVLSSEQAGTIHLGALYHLPYYDELKDREIAFADEVRSAALDAGASLEKVSSYIEENLLDYRYASESHNGVYLLKPDASATKLGGSFGSRVNLIPSDLASAMSEADTPFVSEVYDDGVKGLYIVQTTESFELVEFFGETIDGKKDRVKVIEYDR